MCDGVSITDMVRYHVGIPGVGIMMIRSYQLTRDMTQSKEDFFWYLYNQLGSDFDLMIGYKAEDGSNKFSKWIPYSYLQTFDQWEKIPEVRMTRRQFVKKVGHRTTLDIELMADVDDRGKCFTIQIKANQVYNQMCRWGMNPVMWSTGAKYHINALLPELRDMSEYQRHKRKEWYLNKLGVDMAKKIERSPIALEGEMHWKHDTVKEVIEVER